MDIKELQKNWDDFGKTDPLWSIMTVKEKKNNKWDLKDFFGTGAEKAEHLIKEIKFSNPSAKYGKALDFGCGAGRITNHLGNYFQEAIGADIAPSMIELAKKYKTNANCKFLVNKDPDLKLFYDNSFDFVFSLITLQHMKQKYSQGYIKELARVLKPEGTIIFNLPSKSKSFKDGLIEFLYPQPARTVAHFAKQKIFNFLKLKNPAQGPIMEMHYVNKKKVIKNLAEAGIKIIKVSEYFDGPLVCYEYLGIKK